MKPDTITRRQLYKLLWCALLSPGAELLPAATLGAGRGAWLSTLWALPVFVGAGWLLWTLSRGAGLAGRLAALGWGGKGLLVVCMLWGEVLLALRLRLWSGRMVAAGTQEGPLWLVLAVAAGLTLWLGSKKRAAAARAAELFLLTVGLGGAAVLALSAGQCQAVRLLPLTGDELVGSLGAALPACGVLGYGTFAAFLLHHVEQGGSGRTWPVWAAGICGGLTVLQLVTIGVFGPILAGRLTSPFFALAKSVGVEGAFQRVESLVSALWLFADLALSVLLVLALEEMAAALLPERRRGAVAAAVVLPAAAAALAAFPDAAAVEIFSRGAALWGNLILGGVLPLALFLRWKGREAHISCGQDGESDGISGG